MMSMYPIDLNDWLLRLESNPDNFVDGIPVFDSKKRLSSYRLFHRSRINCKTVFPTMVAMYGLACINRFIEDDNAEYLNKSKRMLFWLEEEIKEHKDFPLSANFFMPTYYLEPPWPNAMTYGLYLSLASRFPNNCELIDVVLQSIFRSVDEGGVLRRLKDNQVWLEEYPSKRGSFVFNGHNFGVIGLFDVEELMSVAQKNAAVSALRSTFKLVNRISMDGGWTFYDLNRMTFSTEAYQRIHIEQILSLRSIAKRLGIPVKEADEKIKSWQTANFSEIPFKYKAIIFSGRVVRLIKRLLYASLRGTK